MPISSLPFRLLSIALLITILAGCAAVPSTSGPAPAAPSLTGAKPTTQASPAVGLPEPGGASPAPTGNAQQPDAAVPAASPTPDLRLPPEQWREWPVVPAATARAQEIYRLGQTLGNDPRHFSKIGDCQSIKEALMGMFDRPGRYRLDASQAYLQETIDHFAGSFNRDGNAVQGGFNAASVLSPMWANPDTCQAGENPLECEYRVHKPAFAIISLEVWWNGRTPERYIQYMRKIIEYAGAHGVVPILSTKADNVEGDNSINLATARLAYEYDLPLWNWWRAAQDLPNGGLDPTRPDGFHLSEDAWIPRGTTALQALDSVWRGVASAGVQPSGNQPIGTPQAGDSDTPAPAGRSDTPAAPLRTGTAAPVTPFVSGKLTGRVLISLAERKDEKLHPLGIYRVDLSTGAKEQVGEAGDALQAQSADGQLLVSRGRDLFAADADGSNPVKVTAALAQVLDGGTAAVWLPGGGAAYLLEQDGQTALVTDRLDGSGWTRLTGASDQPVELFPAPDADRVYWGSAEGVFATTLQGATTPLEGVKRPAFSPQPPQMVFVRTRGEDASLLVLSKNDGSGQREAPLPGDMVLNAVWSPDGKRLSVLLLNRSEYSGRMGSINHFLFTPANFGTRELKPSSGLNPRAAWSRDGQYLLLAGTDPVEAGYRVYARVINTSTLAAVELTIPLAVQSPDLVLVTGLAWEKE